MCEVPVGHMIVGDMSANERDMARKHGLALRDPARPELGWRRTTTFAIPSITGGRPRRTQNNRKEIS
jgi:hypothetical protein